MFLFLLGLLTGFVEHRFTNMRMGLAAHLEGVMNGTFCWRWAPSGQK
jgi:hydroxylaminobenzene mutase